VNDYRVTVTYQVAAEDEVDAFSKVTELVSGSAPGWLSKIERTEVDALS
jgi:hypothetical protein